MRTLKIPFALLLILLYSCDQGAIEEAEIDTDLETIELSIPEPQSPEDNFLCLDNDILFTWNSNQPSGFATVFFRLEISESPSFGADRRIIDGITDSNYQITLEKGKFYYWRVQAYSGTKESDYSQIFSLFTESEAIENHIPFLPKLLAPELLTELSNTNVSLSWSATDIDGDPLLYNLYLSDQNPPKNMVTEGYENTSFEVELERGQNYYWYVEAEDDQGAKSIGEIWQFSIKDFNPSITGNLLKNNSAEDGTNHWTIYGNSGKEITAENQNVFYTRDREELPAYLFQDIEFDQDYSGKYLLVIGNLWAENVVDNSITRHPYLYGYQFNNSGIIEQYMQGQNMRHTEDAQVWQKCYGIYEIDEGVAALRIFLNQAAQAGDPPDGTKARYDDVEVMVFEAYEEAEHYAKNVYLSEAFN